LGIATNLYDLFQRLLRLSSTYGLPREKERGDKKGVYEGNTTISAYLYANPIIDQNTVKPQLVIEGDHLSFSPVRECHGEK
jgi:hypothetical protein